METIISIPAITTLCILFAQLFKSFTKDPAHKHIPALCGTLGLILGIACYITIPGIIPADNWLMAAAVGVVSGLAGTGVHQVFKQNTGSGD